MKTLLIITLLISAFFIACNETGTSNFTVNQEELSSSAKGSMVIYIDQNGAPFSFTGNLKLVDGQCNILLAAPIYDTIFVLDSVFHLDELQLPDSVYVRDTIETQFLRDTIFNRNYQAPTDLKFNEQYDRILGEWLFSYEILPLDKIDPYGSFDFSFSYHD